ncbi:MAG TPA: AAA family ATPase [Thermoanaerobaculia bacterium]|nr:AAA family ATPase [Thermoanaerobaculia bacterium]
MSDARFRSLAETAATHFKLYFLGSVLQVVAQLARNLGTLEGVLEQFPFLDDYLGELARLGVADIAAAGSRDDWFASIRRWEHGISAHLPLRALRENGDLDDDALTLLFTIGLIEEDPRFGFVIECAQPVSPGQQRPTLGLLTAWFRDENEVAPTRERIRLLLDSGLIQVVNNDAPRLQWTFQTPPAIWDAIRGEIDSTPASWLRFRAIDEIRPLDAIVAGDDFRRLLQNVPALLRSGEVRCIVVRGPQHNGRRTIAGAIAAELGRGVLELRGPARPDDERWLFLSAMATLTHAMLVIVLDLGLGETAELPKLHRFRGPVTIVLGKHGAVTGELAERALTLTIPMPSLDQRRALWQQALPAHEPADADLLAERFRMTSGNIATVAGLARTHALLDGRKRVAPDDVRTAGRTLHREIETLAVHIPTSASGWHNMGASAETLDELTNLESRCRHRERLHHHVGSTLAAQLNCGVRALLSGPSGTGKTMSARILAATLEMDLYRLDLASVVNKYLGETEKSLNQLFSRAEELDVILLLDEGDALLTNRTAVQSSNDRYANLETNFLLQRLESFEGILLVTTNAAQRIDSAFQRRMDVIVEFRLPEPHERWAIWQLHLPAGHAVEPVWLEEIAVRCVLTGGQIRNAVLHASLLALDDRQPLTNVHLHHAVRREYRKSGAVCPLPNSSGA